jgi:tetratricopeptide (TPR) repeat protein
VHQTKNRHFSLLATALGAAGIFGLAFGLGMPNALAQETPAPVAEVPVVKEAAPVAPEEAPEAPPEEAPAEPTGPSPEDMLKAKEAFMKGRELFDAKDFENAVDQFKESYKLSKNPVLLYNIAFTHDEIGDAQLATLYYEKFLRDTDKGVANRDLAKKRLKALKKEAGDTPETPDVSAVTAFKHTVVDEAPPGMPLDIVAVVPEGVPWRVVLHYRPAGVPKFTSVEMRYRFKELVARIPKTSTSGKNVQYYLEVEDGSGKVLERSGEPTSPHIVYMEEGAKPRFYADTAGGQVNTQITDTDSPTGGNTGGGSNGATMDTSGGWTDVQSSKFNKLKWGTTAGAATFILLSGTFYLISSSHSDTLEKEALKSEFGNCPSAPCNQFAQKQKDLQSLGQTYETLGTVGLALGAATAVAAGALWYMELTDKGDKKNSTTSLITVPAIGDNYFGAAASIRF